MSTITCEPTETLHQSFTDMSYVKYGATLGFAPFDAASLRLTIPVSRRETLRSPDQPHVVRRLRGVVLELQGADAKVAFDDHGNMIEYFLPASKLHEAGITCENQPFQMDEVESKNADGSFLSGYVFRPLAKPADGFPDGFALDEDRERKRKLIFEKFKNGAH